MNGLPVRRASGLRWRALWWHSHLLGLRWLARVGAHRTKGLRVALQRLLVPMDPWRYYELGRLAGQEFAGSCLDISSPKLLTSWLNARGFGTWTAIDLYRAEIDAWKVVDPTLRLEVQDATHLGYADESFDRCICISVLEHLSPPADMAVLEEIWRVLKPTGVAHLTIDVASHHQDHFIDHPIYGAASRTVDSGVFFKQDYNPSEVAALMAARPWQVELMEYAVQRRESVERRFYAGAPWSYLAGGLLAVICPQNFWVSDSPDILSGKAHGVIYLRLRKPASER